MDIEQFLKENDDMFIGCGVYRVRWDGYSEQWFIYNAKNPKQIICAVDGFANAVEKLKSFL